MNIKTIHTGNITVSVIDSSDVIIKNEQDALDTMANADSDYIVFHDYQFDRDFFDLSTRKLGDVLQKFSNYYKKIAIIGDFDKYPSKVLKSFIYENNKAGDHVFVPSVEDALALWTR